MQFESYFNSVSIDDGRVAFGYGSTGFVYGGFPPPNAPTETPIYGVFSNLGGPLIKVVDKGDILDGKLVKRAHVGRQGLDGNQILTRVFFEDGTDALYVAT